MNFAFEQLFCILCLNVVPCSMIQFSKLNIFDYSLEQIFESKILLLKTMLLVSLTIAMLF